jgi:hypothetical protein
MKPKNFPGRKNDRRKSALARMDAPRAGMSHAWMAEHPHSLLQKKILPDPVARGIRSKKDRSARGKLRA